MHNLLSVPRTHLQTRGDRAFEAVAPKLRNALPAQLRSADSVDSFKANLRTSLFGQEGTLESSDRAAMIQQYLQDLVQRASETNLKGEALHKLWPSMFAEMVTDSVLEMRDQAAFRKTSLAKLSGTK
ncbi:hypothetical protein JOQ06_013663 [Pogonophryne albipinna]|uniref:Uncharacterized protein n=1 Tax=Pogonophryne albipinna TaxID=1090488 RepID=A0AAD6FTR8_9TELE|nr:hypothetical protein JOQ06_013663 [Pogonophryne albipinna]